MRSRDEKELRADMKGGRNRLKFWATVNADARPSDWDVVPLRWSVYLPYSAARPRGQGRIELAVRLGARHWWQEEEVPGLGRRLVVGEYADLAGPMDEVSPPAWPNLPVLSRYRLAEAREAHHAGRGVRTRVAVDERQALGLQGSSGYWRGAGYVPSTRCFRVAS